MRSGRTALDQPTTEWAVRTASGKRLKVESADGQTLVTGSRLTVKAKDLLQTPAQKIALTVGAVA